jgi:galactose mutarotase-like enzyme
MPHFVSTPHPVSYRGTLKNNRYHFNGIDYSLPRHGFARDTNFELINKQRIGYIFTQASSDSLIILLILSYKYNIHLTKTT